MIAPTRYPVQRRTAGDNVWLSRAGDNAHAALASLKARTLNYEVLDSEEAVGRAMLTELEMAAAEKNGELTIILLGGRGAQAMQRLLGEAFFRKVKGFTSMRTDTNDLEAGLVDYLESLSARGEIDLLFLGLGPEAGGASHLAYIKPASGAVATDLAGVIPVSSSILEHHITKFKAGGSAVSAADEAECRQATHILTLGPAAFLRARRIVQAIVDADTAPAKRASFKRLIETEIADDIETRQRQLDENPGLWIRLHPNVRSLILPNVLA